VPQNLEVPLLSYPIMSLLYWEFTASINAKRKQQHTKLNGRRDRSHILKAQEAGLWSGEN
jgi:hypothetical protein